MSNKSTKVRANETPATETVQDSTNVFANIKESSADEILVEIETLKKDTEGMGNRIHNVAIQCMIQGIKHGNFVPMTKLYESLHASQRKEELKFWFMEYAPVQYAKGQFSKDDNAEHGWELEEALKAPYYTKKETVQGKEVDLRAILKMLEGVTKKAGGKKVNPAQAAMIASIASKVSDEIIPMVEGMIAETNAVESSESTGTETTLAA